MPDINLTCCECKNDFYFTERDQKFYAAQNPPFQQPKRCWKCRQKRKTNGSQAPAQPQVQERMPANTANAGRRTDGTRKRYNDERDED